MEGRITKTDDLASHNILVLLVEKEVDTIRSRSFQGFEKPKDFSDLDNLKGSP